MDKRLVLFAVALVAIVLVLPTPTFSADIPKLINYQGMLTNDSGEPLNGTFDVVFRIYNASSDGDQRWTETHSSVPVTDGLFNVILGSQSGGIDLDFSEDYWLEIQVDNDTMPQRLQVTSVGYAYRAQVADSAAVAGSVVETGGGWVDDGAVVRLETAADSVGIGTTTPAAKLDVNGDVNINSDYKIGGNTVVSVSGTANIFAGVGAGESNTGSYATCVGYQAGNINAGEHNTFIGRRAGYVNAAGYRNTFLGSGAGRLHTGGHHNTFVGYGSGYQSTTGNYNTFLGYHAGYHCTTGVQNVFIGYEAGYNEIGSNKLYIANGSGASDVLIYGDFLSGEVGIGTTDPECELDVSGDANVTGTINGCKSQFVRVNTTNSGEYIFDDGWYNYNRPDITTTGTAGEVYIDSHGGVSLEILIKEDGVVVVRTSAYTYTHTASDGKLLEIYVWPYNFTYQFFVHFTGAREGDYVAGLVKGGRG